MTPTEASVPSSLVEPEQQRADRVRTRLVHPVAGDHAVGGPRVLDLEHDALVGLVGDRQRLGDHSVEAGALELGEPSLRSGQLGGRWGDVERRAGAGQRVDKRGAALDERSPGVVVIAEGEQVERDERGRRLLGEHPHPRRGRVDALLQRLEVQAVRRWR